MLNPETPLAKSMFFSVFSEDFIGYAEDCLTSGARSPGGAIKSREKTG
jgi:hypothetical protein